MSAILNLSGSSLAWENYRYKKQIHINYNVLIIATYGA